MIKAGTLALLSLCLGLSVSLSALAQDSDTDEPTPQESEEPELPEDQLVPPEDDPNFKPDPNAPLEEDFLRMRPINNPLYWRVELREQLGWTNNVEQLATGTSSLNNRLTLTGLLRYTWPTQTQILLRSQALMFNYFNAPDYNQAIGIPLSVTGSQWFGNQFNVYAGYIPIVSTSLRNTDNITRFDQDFMAGAAWYQPFDGGHMLFGGYQFDYLMAAEPTFANLGNLFFAGYRHRFADDLFAFVDARVQPRGYTSSAGFLDEIRAGGGLALQWHVFRPWLILEARGDYNQIVNFTTPERSAGIFSFGINLISAIQSDS